jgi:hypothetical protein
MYCTHGAVKHWEYHSTLEATVQHYVVPVLLSTYCTHGAVKYWEYHSTLEATVQHNVVPVLLSTYCTYGAVKYWEYHSTMEATVQHYLLLMFYPPLQHRDTALNSTWSTVFSCYHFIAFNRRVLSCSCCACVVSHALTLLLSISLLFFCFSYY